MMKIFTLNEDSLVSANIANFVETLVNFDTHEILQCNDANNAYDKFIEMFTVNLVRAFLCILLILNKQK